MSRNSSGNVTQLFGQACQPVTMLPSEERAQNLTTVVTLIQFNSSLVVSEATTRGILLIGAEIMLVLAIVLRKLVCSRFKKDTDVDREELLFAQEAGAVRQMKKCENGNGQRLVESKSNPGDEESNEKEDGDD
jgi:hypothetical protein